MKGKYTITVHDNLVSYSLELERKITVIKGESGIGKSHMYSLLTDLAKRGKNSGVKCNMTSSIVVLSITSWERLLQIMIRLFLLMKWIFLFMTETSRKQ